MALRRQLNLTFDPLGDKVSTHPSFSVQLSKWLLATAGNSLMQQLWNTTMLRNLVYVNLSLRSKHGDKSRHHINALIDAILLRQPDEARTVARALTWQTLRDLAIKRGDLR